MNIMFCFFKPKLRISLRLGLKDVSIIELYYCFLTIRCYIIADNFLAGLI